MRTSTLVANRLYFGLDALRLRAAAGRVLARVQDAPPERATVRVDALAEDFRVSAAATRPLVDEMVRQGLLARLAPGGIEYAITDRLRECAHAPIVEPLPRLRAQMLLAHLADIALHFNRTATHNKYEIDAIAVFGEYLGHEPQIAELALGVTGRRRLTVRDAAAGRGAGALQGHERIRTLLERQGEVIDVRFFHRLGDVPRPFSVVFRAAP
jgi:hypothetical protein